MRYRVLIIIFLSILINGCNERKIEGLMQKADNLSNEGKYKSAILVYNEIIEKNNSFAKAFADRGGINNLLGNYDSALVDLNYSIRLDSSNSDYLILRGAIKENLSDLKGAKDDYEKAINIDSNYLALNNLGMISMEHQDYDSALNLFNASLKIKTHSMTYNNRGTLMERMGKSKEAIDDYTKALSIDTGVVLYYYNRSVSRYSIDDFIGAIEDLSMAIEKQPKDPNLYYYRGIIYREIDSIYSCCKDLKKAIVLGNQEAVGMYQELCDKESI